MCAQIMRAYTLYIYLIFMFITHIIRILLEMQKITSRFEDHRLNMYILRSIKHLHQSNCSRVQKTPSIIRTSVFEIAQIN